MRKRERKSKKKRNVYLCPQREIYLILEREALHTITISDGRRDLTDCNIRSKGTMYPVNILDTFVKIHASDQMSRQNLKTQRKKAPL